MPDGNGRPSVAVVGAAGFVGRALLNALEAIDLRATAVVRGAPELAVQGSFHGLPQPLWASQADFDVVVNLAYPTSGRGFEHVEQNPQIANTVSHLARDGGRVIQVSTQAVFGLALDRPVILGPVAKTRDNGYVESKIEAEHLFVRAAAGARPVARRRAPRQRMGICIGHLGGTCRSATRHWEAGLRRGRQGLQQHHRRRERGFLPSISDRRR